MRRDAPQIIARSLAGLALVLLLVGHASSDEEQSLPAMISSAKTASDHEKIATYFDAAAKDAQQRSEQHSRLMQAYKSLGGAPAAKLKLEEHCANLSRSAQSEAREYQDLAKAHRDMARGAVE